jgi:hypothetical protein
MFMGVGLPEQLPVNVGYTNINRGPHKGRGERMAYGTLEQPS